MGDIGSFDATPRFERLARQAVSVAGHGDAATNWVAERQRGVIGRWQAEACGLGRKAISGRCARRTWRLVFRGAFVIGPAEPDYAGRALAGILALGRGVAGGADTAAWFYGLLEREPAQVHITVLDGRNRARLAAFTFIARESHADRSRSGGVKAFR